jgi:hypothetical protein
MSVRMQRRLESLEMEARVSRLRVYWVDPETGARELIAGGGGSPLPDGRGSVGMSVRREGFNAGSGARNATLPLINADER